MGLASPSEALHRKNRKLTKQAGWLGLDQKNRILKTKEPLAEQISFAFAAAVERYQMNQILKMQKTVPLTPTQMILYFHC